jgi:uncharacterized protein YbaR (Trm112 family)
LYRVARKYLILLEPGYELANDEARNRMDHHGYCRNLKGISESLGCDVVEHRLFPYTANPMNPTAITIIRKESGTACAPEVLACPQFKTPLKRIENALFSPEALVVYPIIRSIPCLRKENGIRASKFEELLSDGRPGTSGRGNS